MARKEPNAILYLEVEYEEYPDDSSIREVMDAARNYGYPRKALLVVSKPHNRDLTKEY